MPWYLQLAVMVYIVALGEHVGWWRFAIPWESCFLTLLWINSVLCAFVFLITGRIACRFGGRGLAVGAVVAAVIGPIRDYWYIERFREWGAYAPGGRPSRLSPRPTPCWGSWGTE
jgi:hypothetical protein